MSIEERVEEKYREVLARKSASSVDAWPWVPTPVSELVIRELIRSQIEREDLIAKRVWEEAKQRAWCSVADSLFNELGIKKPTLKRVAFDVTVTYRVEATPTRKSAEEVSAKDVSRAYGVPELFPDCPPVVLDSEFRDVVVKYIESGRTPASVLAVSNIRVID